MGGMNVDTAKRRSRSAEEQGNREQRSRTHRSSAPLLPLFLCS